MKTLSNFLLESIDENLFWKIDKYFERNKEEYNQFVSLVNYCREMPGFNNQTIEEWLKTNKFTDIKKFVDFLDDIVKSETSDRDYSYILYKAIKLIIANKKQGEKYK